MMMVNNEIGAVEPVEEAIKVIKEKNPNTLVHVDAIQAYGKYRIFPKNWGLICFLSADIKSMRRKEQDFCSSKIRRR